MLDELIQQLKSKILQGNSLQVFCYHFINEQQTEINQLDTSQFTGEVEKIAISSFSQKYEDNRNELKKIANKLTNNSIYKKHLNIYHFLGLSLQDDLNSINIFENHLEDDLNNTIIFQNHLQEYFNNHSVRFKYLITKVFNKFEEPLKKYLLAQVEIKDNFTLVLQHLYLESAINKNQIINRFEKNLENLDIIDLILLEDLRDIQSIEYNRQQKQLFDDIRWCATEIQSKYKTLNNNEDQYNSLFQSLLTAKNYKTLDQPQRGKSSSGTQYGELDIAVFTKEDIQLSILEAFIIKSINKDYIKKHLKKLSENYDPNGLKNNYAIIYAKSKKFADFWEKYKNFVPTIDFEHEMLNKQVEDITSRYPQFTGIKIGLTKHQNRGSQVQIYHIFMDMNL